MAERAHPDDKRFKDRYLGLIKNQYRMNLFRRYSIANEFVKGQTVLDIPCGMGWGTSLLSGCHSLYGVDISLDAIAEAKKKYPDIDFSVGNMTEMQFNNHSFDVIICLEGFEHITFLQGQKFLKETKRVLKSNGMLIVSTPLLVDGRYHSGNKYHLCEYREEEFFQVMNESRYKLIKKEYISNKQNIIIAAFQKNEKLAINYTESV